MLQSIKKNSSIEKQKEHNFSKERSNEKLKFNKNFDENSFNNYSTIDNQDIINDNFKYSTNAKIDKFKQKIFIPNNYRNNNNVNFRARNLSNKKKK